MEEILYEEKKTPAGYLVKVRLAKMNYVVFTPKGSPEIPRGSKSNSIVVPVPRVVFLGVDFDLSHFVTGDLSFVNVKGGKMVIPYQHAGIREVKTIFFNSGSMSDVLPVIVYHFTNSKELIRSWEAGTEFHHLVLDEDFPRQEMVTLKIRFPALNILILKKRITSMKDAHVPEEEDKKDKEVIDADKMRATDLLSKGVNLNMYSQNPVFLARLHLRNLELDKVKQLLFDFNLGRDDIQFIRTFLGVMIKNENNKEELRNVNAKIVILDEIFRLSLMILEKSEIEFEEELTKGFDREVANMLNTLLEKYMDEAKNIEDELIFWEWKYRTRRLAA